MTRVSWRDRHTPKLVTCLREGYGTRTFVSDFGAGLTVAVIALPLAMALGIASIPQNVADELAAIHPWLTPPAMGLFTAVVAGAIISILGGSRYQIGGPTAAFMPLVFAICAAHGYAGLVLATCMAGVILILLGLFRFGGVIKFVPYPVVAGFTAGIGVVIMTSQIKDFFGLALLTPEGGVASVPAEFIGKLEIFWANRHTFNLYSVGIALGSLLILARLPKLAPRVPAAIVAVGLSAIVVKLMGWSSATVVYDGVHVRPMVETIGTRFGGIPSNLPRPQLPTITLDMVRALIPAATAIAFLGAIESLLSAVVADGMTGSRHRSDQELVAQGSANIASVLFFGLPATGAIARTAANIRSGGKTPVAGILHALFILLFMLALAPLAKAIPLASLAAVLVMVAWKVSDLENFRRLLMGPKPDVLVLLTTFGLTVIFDLTIAIGTGVVLASLLFMQRMTQITTVRGLDDTIGGIDTEAPDPKDPGRVEDLAVPPDVVVYEINGPFFFGVANKLQLALDQLQRPPKIIILRMRYVPHIDATGLNALREFHAKCRRRGTTLLLGGVHAHPMFELARVGLDDEIGLDNMFENLDDALVRARSLLNTGHDESPSVFDQTAI
ncbi:MAG: STAS domain-containing protein [Phycisphaeraceae bacterium]|nr:STAS domain-containing protein [Phycisphaeraceae bacterium]MCW5763287.1 STAS domain-containing protein [Phycisphaeraceae bacterium]